MVRQRRLTSDSGWTARGGSSPTKLLHRVNFGSQDAAGTFPVAILPRPAPDRLIGVEVRSCSPAGCIRPQVQVLTVQQVFTHRLATVGWRPRSPPTVRGALCRNRSRKAADVCSCCSLQSTPPAVGQAHRRVVAGLFAVAQCWSPPRLARGLQHPLAPQFGVTHGSGLSAKNILAPDRCASSHRASTPPRRIPVSPDQP